MTYSPATWITNCRVLLVWKLQISLPGSVVYLIEKKRHRIQQGEYTKRRPPFHLIYLSSASCNRPFLSITKKRTEAKEKNEGNFSNDTTPKAKAKKKWMASEKKSLTITDRTANTCSVDRLIKHGRFVPKRHNSHKRGKSHLFSGTDISQITRPLTILF